MGFIIKNMNELDNSWYRALKFLADNTRAEIISSKERGEKDYEENVPSTKENPIEQTLKEFAYIELEKNTKWMITQRGLQQLRELEQIRHRDLTIWISGLALAISIFTLAINLGWIKFT